MEKGIENGAPVAPAVVGTILGIAVLVGLLTYLSGKAVPFAKDDRSAVIALAIVGLVMCAFGIVTTGGSLGWFSPGMFIGAALGIILLTSFVAAITGRPVPVVGEYRTALVIMACVMGAKWLVSTSSLIVRLVR